MPRPQGSVNRANRSSTSRWGREHTLPLTLDQMSEQERQQEEIKEIDRETLDSMSNLNHGRLSRMDPAKLTLRQQQSAGAEYLAALVGHPKLRRRLVEEGLADPMTLLKIASSERPKEVHVDGEIKHSVVVVPTQLSAEDWTKHIETIEGELSEEKPW